ncbi:hypothetical protein ACGFJ7_26460 [Actinoplanes sp. NPDC048988]|uniref:hypothetical protein n=1 Tax=Actinoplanes sp. NPDC048988 TaxID=3363901 RepID=UPI003712EA5C
MFEEPGATVGRSGVSGGPATIGSDDSLETVRSAVPRAVILKVYVVPLIRWST